jgi:hypothetical protein
LPSELFFQKCESEKRGVPLIHVEVSGRESIAGSAAQPSA